MERRVSMSKRFILALVATVFMAAAIPADADHVLVLIAGIDNPLRSVSPIEVRKLYLGFNVINDSNRPIQAISNVSDPRLWDIFLQDVMGMSERSYRRRLLTLTLQSGRSRPDTAKDRELMLDRIEHDPDAISFSWQEDIEDRPNIKVLRVLWQK
jgi:hypothetical protein